MARAALIRPLFAGCLLFTPLRNGGRTVHRYRRDYEPDETNRSPFNCPGIPDPRPREIWGNAQVRAGLTFRPTVDLHEPTRSPGGVEHDRTRRARPVAAASRPLWRGSSGDPARDPATTLRGPGHRC